nr:MAG TPA: hypothetical protein [Siphoviridae sp. ctV7v5]
MNFIVFGLLSSKTKQIKYPNKMYSLVYSHRIIVHHHPSWIHRP